MPSTKRSPRPSNPDKVALIRGASRGLGRVLAGFLARQGYALIVTARGATDLEAVADEVRADGATVASIGGDVRDASHRQRLIETARAWGRLDLLVNNASELGDSPLPSLEKASRETFLRVLDANFLAPLALVHAAMALLTGSGGPVVNI